MFDTTGVSRNLNNNTFFGASRCMCVSVRQDKRTPFFCAFANQDEHVHTSLFGGRSLSKGRRSSEKTQISRALIAADGPGVFFSLSFAHFHTQSTHSDTKARTHTHTHTPPPSALSLLSHPYVTQHHVFTKEVGVEGGGHTHTHNKYTAVHTTTIWFLTSRRRLLSLTAVPSGALSFLGSGLEGAELMTCFRGVFSWLAIWKGKKKNRKKIYSEIYQMKIIIMLYCSK